MAKLPQMISDVLKEWAPAKSAYRERFNETARLALDHAKQHSDTSFIARLALGVPSPKYRADIIKRLESQFQFRLNLEKKFFERLDKNSIAIADLTKFVALEKGERGSSQGIGKVLAPKAQGYAIKVPQDVFNNMTHLWFPEDQNFLRGLSEYIIFRLLKASRPGRLDKLSAAVFSIPDKEVRTVIQHFVSREFALDLSADGSLLLKQTRFDAASINESFHERFAAAVNRGRARSILIGSARVTTADFANAVADIITENRATLSETDLAIMAEVIVLASDRARKSQRPK